MRIMLVDDQAEFREGLRALLSTAAEVEIVGEASHGGDALALAIATQPDVILMDVRMPHVDGIEASRNIRAQLPDACILMLTTFDDDDSVARAIQAGARGYLLKGTPRDDMLDILRLAVRGYAAIGRGVSLGTVTRAGAAVAKGEVRVNEREREVWKLIGEGFTNREIAEKLHFAEGTVKNLVSSLLGALSVRHRTQAALLWKIHNP